MAKKVVVVIADEIYEKLHHIKDYFDNETLSEAVMLAIYDLDWQVENFKEGYSIELTKETDDKIYKKKSPLVKFQEEDLENKIKKEENLSNKKDKFLLLKMIYLDNDINRVFKTLFILLKNIKIPHIII